MEKKESTTSSPLGICEKLFNSFRPAFRPLRRLAFHQKEPEGPTPQAPPTSVKPRPPAPEMKPAEAIAPKPQPHVPPPKPARPPPPPSAPAQKVPEKVAPSAATPPPPPPPKTVATPQPAPPKAATIPAPAPPKGVAPPEPVPLPVRPAGAAAATERSKNMNEKFDNYIKSAKPKVRTARSGAGRAPNSQ